MGHVAFDGCTVTHDASAAPATPAADSAVQLEGDEDLGDDEGRLKHVLRDVITSFAWMHDEDSLELETGRVPFPSAILLPGLATRP